MDTDDIQPLTVTVEQAAKLLGIGRSTAYELVHTGDIPSLRLGRRILVPCSYIAQAVGAAPITTGPMVPSWFGLADSGLPGPSLADPDNARSQ
jgi:excisionase family DNA binding protein